MSASPSFHIDIASRQNTLARLSQARRVFDRLDWWPLDAWAGSPLFHINDEAALLFAPADMTPSQMPHESHIGAAWLRWCALADGISASPVIPRMIHAAHDALVRAGVADALAIVHPQDWLLTYLQDAGYHTIDRMLTFEIEPSRIVDQPLADDLTIRDAFARDLAMIEQIDARCFLPAWRYPPATMQPAFNACRIFTLAEWHDEPVGYCCALLHEDHGHVVRLAVDEAHRNAGVGAAMLAHVAHALTAQGASSISLNTQGSNIVSQRLYLRMGFAELIERPLVLHKPLLVLTNGVGA